MTFPRRPFLDRVIVQEIPLEQIFEQSQVQIPLDDVRVKLRSDRGIVVAIGAITSVMIGDIVFYDEFCLCDPVYLNPGDQYRNDLPKYWQIRLGDLKGFDAVRRDQLLDGSLETKFMNEKHANA